MARLSDARVGEIGDTYVRDNNGNWNPVIDKFCISQRKICFQIICNRK